MNIIKLSSLTKAMYSRDINTTRSYCMDLSMNADDFDNIFYFKANSIMDIRKKSTEFYVDANNWPDISFSNGIVSNNGKKDIEDYLLTENKVKLLGPAWLANNITNGISKSSKIFSNEKELIQQYITLDNHENKIGIKQSIIDKLSKAGSKSEPLTNLNINDINITKEIISHFLISKNPNIMSRFDNMMNNDNVWNAIKFTKGDVLQFDIIYDINMFCREKYNAEDQDFLVKITLY